jgi:hypothetical protein
MWRVVEELEFMIGVDVSIEIRSLKTAGSSRQLSSPGAAGANFQILSSGLDWRSQGNLILNE